MIELLVVVAIIGILASVVLASLNTARAKGSDAAVKANLDNMRAEAAIYFDGNGANTYGTASGQLAITSSAACTSVNTTLIGDVTFCNGMVAAASASGTTAYVNVLAQSWVAGAALKATASTWWCVDSSGASKLETASALDNTKIVAATTACP